MSKVYIKQKALKNLQSTRAVKQDLKVVILNLASLSKGIECPKIYAAASLRTSLYSLASFRRSKLGTKYYIPETACNPKTILVIHEMML